ncbi:MAG: T9SS type A sorting domain-containing protein [Chitinophagales bacterium]
MKSKLFYVIAISFAILIIQTIQVKAQTCTLTNIYSPLDWTYPLDVNGLEDIAYDVEAIDANSDGIPDDGLVVVGTTNKNSTVHKQAIVIRLDASGNEVWKQTYGGSGDDNGYAIEQASDGNLLVCGTKYSTLPGGTIFSNNVWIFKVDLATGNKITGSEHVYGGVGNETGFDIKEDVTNGYYVVAGATGKYNTDDLDLTKVPAINGLGEYWVFQIDPATYNIQWEAIYNGVHTGNDTTFDWAHSILIDHAGDYVVSGYCESCEPDKVHQQAMLVKIHPSGVKVWQKNYGDILDPANQDQGSYNVIEVFDGTNYSYLSNGIDHTPATGTNCYGADHDALGLNTNINGGNLWTGGCHLDEGLNYGGSLKENGWCSVQTCDGGYLLVGGEASLHSISNNITCNIGNSDLWVVKINSSGGYVWDQSLGDVYNDEIHSIKQLWDGSFIIAGQRGTALNGPDIYVAKFELTFCPAPAAPISNVVGCQVALSWDATACAKNYVLRYKKSTATIWTPIYPASNPTNLTLPTGTYVWTVESLCSPNVNTTSSVQNFTVGIGCRIGNEENAGNGNLIAVFPNPSDGSFEISLSLEGEPDQIATVDILDQVGKVVSSFKAAIINGLLDAPLSDNDLPSGFYSVRVIINGHIYKTKLVIQKA